ncbi:putative DNA modification/repair radical SAM protein [Acidimangrovimonas sediminis]|uniref:putative DNA modification/repair radical SAM protein n=1 Tax=Acidimangrovimonas sediminis TaxID=2056283 RepID=UPI000C80C464|nr:putative DNA modification/repair radical SAM protein [Acidimangrovimonas sediminis]
MVKRSLSDKLAILADAAKYDASCASSGGERRTSTGRGTGTDTDTGTGRGPGGKAGLGSSGGAGICHSYAPDGRCISLLKILMTNFCIYDCAYCVNRASSRVERARFSVEEVVRLTVEFYRRNYIEGLFLSSGIIRSPDETMGDMVRIARTLRVQENFRGYIHLKTIPDAAPELIEEAGRWADRLSINVELPTETALGALAPEKSAQSIRRAMADVRARREAAKDRTLRGTRPARFAPAGQSTQMIVGADAAKDSEILATSAGLYAGYRLGRVYYSAFSPIPDSSRALPLIRPPLMREHRLYQADWLMRFYGFAANEIAPPSGMLDLTLDPKLAWALAHRAAFPVEVNRAPREMLLRVPGFGSRSVERILAARRHRTLRYEDLVAIGCVMKHARPFVTLPGWSPGARLDAESLRARFAPSAEQLSLF